MVVVFCEERNAWLFALLGHHKFFPPPGPLFSHQDYFQIVSSSWAFFRCLNSVVCASIQFRGVPRPSRRILSHMCQPASQSTPPSVYRQLDDPSKWWLLTPSLESISQSCPMPDNPFAMAPFLGAFRYGPCIEE